jgi:hypothetical protein
MSVTFTASTLGPTASSFTLTSSSGVTGSGASSPLTLEETVIGTYTYTVSGTNANGTGPSSAASNSVNVASLFSSVGAYEPIANITVPSGGSSSISFIGIPQTYTHLQIRAIAKTTFVTYAGNGINLYFNSDTTSAKYTHQLYGTGSGSAAAQTIPNYMNISYIPGNQGGSANMYGPVICDILDYSSTSKNKTLRALAGWDNNGSGLIVVNSAFNGSTDAINSISMNSDSGTDFMQYSSFALYGIKG